VCAAAGGDFNSRRMINLGLIVVWMEETKTQSVLKFIAGCLATGGSMKGAFEPAIHRSRGDDSSHELSPPLGQYNIFLRTLAGLYLRL
jgi:hypothetical protein